MYEEIMRKIGLTNSEIAVYSALVKLGSSTTGPIVKEANISSGKIYEILDKLIGRGLVSYIIKSGKKYFQTTEPSRFKEYLDLQQRDLEDIKKNLDGMIQYFEQRLKQPEEVQTAEIFEGIEGFKTFSEFCLKVLTKDMDFCILGVSKEVNEIFGAYLLDWQKRRAKKEVSLRVMYNEDARTYGKKREKIKNTLVRYLPKNMTTPALIEIFGSYVATLIVAPKPIIFLIKSKEAANSYLQYFNLVWKQAKA